MSENGFRREQTILFTCELTIHTYDPTYGQNFERYALGLMEHRTFLKHFFERFNTHSQT